MLRIQIHVLALLLSLGRSPRSTSREERLVLVQLIPRPMPFSPSRPTRQPKEASIALTEAGHILEQGGRGEGAGGGRGGRRGSMSLTAPKEGLEVVLDVVELDNLGRGFLGFLELYC